MEFYASRCTVPEWLCRSYCKMSEKCNKGSYCRACFVVSELQTVFSEAANLVNESPIGRHTTEPEETSYLSPNHLLLGRASARVPSGPFEETNNPKKTFPIAPEYHRAILEKMDQILFSYVINSTEVAH